MGSEKSAAAVAAFPTAAAAGRLIAGVAAAGRAVRRLAEEGETLIEIRIADGSPLSVGALEDVERLRGRSEVSVGHEPITTSGSLGV